jgi:hypothetical protein
VTGDGVHARRSIDLVPTLTWEGALDRRAARKRGCLILILGTGVPPTRYWTGGTGVGAPFARDPKNL